MTTTKTGTDVLYKSFKIAPAEDGSCSRACPQNNGIRCFVKGNRIIDGVCQPYITLLRHQVTEARLVAELALLGNWKDPIPWEGDYDEESS